MPDESTPGEKRADLPNDLAGEIKRIAAAILIAPHSTRGRILYDDELLRVEHSWAPAIGTAVSCLLGVAWRLDNAGSREAWLARADSLATLVKERLGDRAVFATPFSLGSLTGCQISWIYDLGTLDLGEPE